MRVMSRPQRLNTLFQLLTRRYVGVAMARHNPCPQPADVPPDRRSGAGARREFFGHGLLSQNGQQPVAAAYWTAPDNGRFVARLSTDDAYAVWGAQVLLHPHRSVETLVGLNLTQGVNIVGHANTTSPFDWSEVEALHLHARAGAVEVSVDQLLNGAWVKGASHVLQAGETIAVYPYPDVEVGRINIVNTPVFSLDVQLQSFADHNQVDAPSYLPENLDVDNTSWPVLNLTETTSGQLTLAVHDTTDTYRLVVDGWEDSIHFVQFVVDGPIEGLELQLWDMDQATSETLATDITQPVGDQLKIGLQVGRGTHFLQIRFQNASEAAPHLWGEDVEPRTYVLQHRIPSSMKGKNRGSLQATMRSTGATSHGGSWVFCFFCPSCTSSSTFSGQNPTLHPLRKRSSDSHGTPPAWTAERERQASPNRHGQSAPRRCPT